MIAGRTPPPIRPLRRDELDAATDTLNAAFADDPLFGFLIPEPKRRAAVLETFFASALTECLAAGGAFTFDDDGPDGGPMSGAMGLIPPGHWPIPLYRTFASIRVPRAIPTWAFIKAGLHLERRIRALHPPEPHLYVYVVGVRKKGQGHGGALLRHACALATASSTRVHLETGNPINLPFYRRFGLEVGTEITTHDGPPVWVMTQP